MKKNDCAEAHCANCGFVMTLDKTSDPPRIKQCEKCSELDYRIGYALGYAHGAEIQIREYKKTLQGQMSR